MEISRAECAGLIEADVFVHLEPLGVAISRAECAGLIEACPQATCWSRWPADFPR